LVPRAELLFAIGADEGYEISERGKPRFAGCTDLHRLFDKREPTHLMHVTRQMLRQRRRPEMEQYRFILNLITDPDQNPRTLENLVKVLRDYRGKVLNPPEAVLRTTRDKVARRLKGTPGMVVPKVIRLRNARPDVALRAIEQAGMQFPLIVRLAGTHTGKIVGLFGSADEVGAALSGDGEHIITEFVDFQSPDGLYRKYRAFFIGPRIIFRHMLVSDAWNVHARDRLRFMAERPKLLAEEAAMFAVPEGKFPLKVIATLEAVRERMGLDYFGMDFGIAADGRPILFEANATMNFFPFLADPRFDHVRACLEPARQAFHEMLGCAASHAVMRPNFQLSL
jgi:hypothetical protein